jgi:hypothetical protein
MVEPKYSRCSLRHSPATLAGADKATEPLDNWSKGGPELAQSVLADPVA